MSKKVVTLGLLDILDYIGNNSFRKLITEAENILNSRGLIMCGEKTWKSNKRVVQIIGICVEFPDDTFPPFIVNGRFFREKECFKIGKFKCTCGEVRTGFCRHCIAVLLYCNRNNIEDLEKIPESEVKCLVNEDKSTSLDPVPLSAICCFKRGACLEPEDESDLDVGKSVDNIVKENPELAHTLLPVLFHHKMEQAEHNRSINDENLKALLKKGKSLDMDSLQSMDSDESF